MIASLGLFQGFISAEHSIPEGARIINLKICENCGKNFSRNEHSAVKFCGECAARRLMPVDNSAYRDMLPTEAEQRHAHRLPHYDDSLVPRKKLELGWLAKILFSLNNKGPMTAREMVETAGVSCRAASEIVGRCKQSGVELVQVGSAWPRKTRAVTKLYFLKDVV